MLGPYRPPTSFGHTGAFPADGRVGVAAGLAAPPRAALLRVRLEHGRSTSQVNIEPMPQPFRARQGHPRPPRPGSAVASVVLASCLAGATAGPALAQTRAAPAPLRSEEHTSELQ